METEFEKWLAPLNDKVKRTARIFGPGMSFRDSNKIRKWVVGYKDDGGLILSSVNPLEDYERAVTDKSQQSIVCPRCLVDVINKSKPLDVNDPAHSVDHLNECI